MALDWLVRTVSFFNTILLMWLGLMVILTGNRKSIGTWIVSGGLFLGAVFFISHTMIMGGNIARLSWGINFWWTVSWVPAVAAPVAWYGAMLWYAGFRLDQPHSHKKFIVLIMVLMVLIGILIVAWNEMPQYQYLISRVLPGIESSFEGLPLIVFTYLILSVLCYLLPLDLLGQDLFSERPLAAAAFRKARPWLMMASIALLLASLVMIWTAIWILESTPMPSLTVQADLLRVKRLDLLVASLVGLAIILLGRAIVAYEVFTGRPLPRNRFSRQWRSTVILAAGYSSVIAFGVTIHLPMLYIIMSATLLFTVFYGLYSWRSYAERDAVISRVRPLLSSGEIFSQVTEADQIDRTGPHVFFATLCQNILSVPAAVIIPAPWVAPLVDAPLVFNPFDKPLGLALSRPIREIFSDSDLQILPGQTEGVAWMVSLWRDKDLIGVLLLGEKADGNPFTAEEIEVAQLGGERLLDMLSGTEMARMAIALLRERISEMTIMEAKSRRVLHDEILPEIHMAILALSGGDGDKKSEEVVKTLSKTHHMLSDLIRDQPPVLPERLSKIGLMAALRDMVCAEFESLFQTIEWHISPEIDVILNGLPTVRTEVLYFAIRELVRNAGKHAGGRPGKKVNLKVSASVTKEQIRFEIQDDGVGLAMASNKVTEGGQGLRFHTAMLAVVGAQLEMQPGPEKGTSAIIRVPRTE
jgi:signal transduction histidine kinase